MEQSHRFRRLQTSHRRRVNWFDPNIVPSNTMGMSRPSLHDKTGQSCSLQQPTSPIAVSRNLLPTKFTNTCEIPQSNACYPSSREASELCPYPDISMPILPFSLSTSREHSSSCNVSLDNKQGNCYNGSWYNQSNGMDNASELAITSPMQPHIQSNANCQPSHNFPALLLQHQNTPGTSNNNEFRCTLQLHDSEKLPQDCLVNSDSLLKRFLASNHLLFPKLCPPRFSTKNNGNNNIRSESPNDTNKMSCTRDKQQRFLKALGLIDGSCKGSPMSGYVVRNDEDVSMTTVALILIEPVNQPNVEIVCKLLPSSFVKHPLTDSCGISVSSSIAKAVGLNPGKQDANIRIVSPEDIEIVFVEVLIGEQYFSRRDMFHIQRLLSGEVLYQGLPPTGLPHTFSVRSLLVEERTAIALSGSKYKCSPNQLFSRTLKDQKNGRSPDLPSHSAGTFTSAHWVFTRHSATAHPIDEDKRDQSSRIRPLFTAAGVYAPGVSDTARVVRVSSGLIGEKTKFTFRSRCQHIFILIQISSELWWYSREGVPYFARLEAFFEQLFQRYKKGGQHHYLSFVLFYRLRVFSRDQKDLQSCVLCHRLKWSQHCLKRRFNAEKTKYQKYLRSSAVAKWKSTTESCRLKENRYSCKNSTTPEELDPTLSKQYIRNTKNLLVAPMDIEKTTENRFLKKKEELLSNKHECQILANDAIANEDDVDLHDFNDTWDDDDVATSIEDRYDVIWEGPLQQLLQDENDRRFLRRLRRDILDFPSSILWDAPCFISPDCCTRKAYTSDVNETTSESGGHYDEDPERSKRLQFQQFNTKTRSQDWKVFSRKVLSQNVHRHRYNRGAVIDECQTKAQWKFQNGDKEVNSMNASHMPSKKKERFKNSNRKKFIQFLTRRIVQRLTRLKKQSCSNCHKGLKKRWWAEPALAAEGNFFEAVNMTLNHFSIHHVDRSLAQTGKRGKSFLQQLWQSSLLRFIQQLVSHPHRDIVGQAIVVITAGNGSFYSSDVDLVRLTKHRLNENVAAPDVVYLRDAPLHRIPLLISDTPRHFTSSQPQHATQRTSKDVHENRLALSELTDSDLQKSGFSQMERTFYNENVDMQKQFQVPPLLSGLVEYEEIFWLVIHIFKGTKDYFQIFTTEPKSKSTENYPDHKVAPSFRPLGIFYPLEDCHQVALGNDLFDSYVPLLEPSVPPSLTPSITFKTKRGSSLIKFPTFENSLTWRRGKINGTNSPTVTRTLNHNIEEISNTQPNYHAHTSAKRLRSWSFLAFDTKRHSLCQSAPSFNATSFTINGPKFSRGRYIAPTFVRSVIADPNFHTFDVIKSFNPFSRPPRYPILHGTRSHRNEDTRIRDLQTRRWSHVYAPPREGTMLWESLLQPAVLPVTTEFFFYHGKHTSRPLTNWKVTGTPKLFEAFQRRELIRSKVPTELPDMLFFMNILLYDLVGVRLALDLQVTRADLNLHLLDTSDGRPHSVQTWMNDFVHELTLVDDGQNILVEHIKVPSPSIGKSSTSEVPECRKHADGGSQISHPYFNRTFSRHSVSPDKNIHSDVSKNGEKRPSPRNESNGYGDQCIHPKQESPLTCVRKDESSTIEEKKNIGVIPKTTSKKISQHPSRLERNTESLPQDGSIILQQWQNDLGKEKRENYKESENFGTSLLREIISMKLTDASAGEDSHIERDSSSFLSSGVTASIDTTNSEDNEFNDQKQQRGLTHKENVKKHSQNIHHVYRNQNPIHPRITTESRDTLLYDQEGDRLSFTTNELKMNNLSKISIEPRETHMLENSILPFSMLFQQDEKLSNLYLSSDDTIDNPSRKRQSLIRSVSLSSQKTHTSVEEPIALRRRQSVSSCFSTPDINTNSCINVDATHSQNYLSHPIDSCITTDLLWSASPICQSDERISAEEKCRAAQRVFSDSLRHPVQQCKGFLVSKQHGLSEKLTPCTKGEISTFVKTTLTTEHAGNNGEQPFPLQSSNNFEDQRRSRGDALHFVNKHNSWEALSQRGTINEKDHRKPPKWENITVNKLRSRSEANRGIQSQQARFDLQKWNNIGNDNRKTQYSYCEENYPNPIRYACLVRHRGVIGWENIVGIPFFDIPSTLRTSTICYQKMKNQHYARIITKNKEKRKCILNDTYFKWNHNTSVTSPLSENNNALSAMTPLNKRRRESEKIMTIDSINEDPYMDNKCTIPELRRSRSHSLSCSQLKRHAKHRSHSDYMFQINANLTSLSSIAPYKKHQQMTSNVVGPRKKEIKNTAKLMPHCKKSLRPETATFLYRRSPLSYEAIPLQQLGKIKRYNKRCFPFKDHCQPHTNRQSHQLDWQPTLAMFRSRGPTYFNILDEIVTWQRLQPPVASMSEGFNGAVLGIRALSFVIVPASLVYHTSLLRSNNKAPSLFSTLSIDDFVSFGQDPYTESGLKSAFEKHPQLVKQAQKLKRAMEQLLLKHSPDNTCSSSSQSVSLSSGSQRSSLHNDNNGMSLSFSVSVPSGGLSGIQLKSTRVVSSWCHGSVWCPSGRESRGSSSGMLWSTSPISHQLGIEVELQRRQEVLRGPHTPLDWFVINYDSHFCPPFLFKFSIEWLVCSSLFICRLVRRLRVMAACYGFTLIDLPTAQLLSRIQDPSASIPSISPEQHAKNHYHTVENKWETSTHPESEAETLLDVDQHLTDCNSSSRVYEKQLESPFCINKLSSTFSNITHHSGLDCDYQLLDSLTTMQHERHRCLYHIAPIQQPRNRHHHQSSTLPQWTYEDNRLLPFHPPWSLKLKPSRFVCNLSSGRLDTNDRDVYRNNLRREISSTFIDKLQFSSVEECFCTLCSHNELAFYRSLLITLLRDSQLQLLFLCNHEYALRTECSEGRGLPGAIEPGWLLIERHGLLFVHICRRRIICHSHYLQWKWSKSSAESTPFIGGTTASENVRNGVWRSQRTASGIKRIVLITHQIARKYFFDCELSDVYRFATL